MEFLRLYADYARSILLSRTGVDSHSASTDGLPTDALVDIDKLVDSVLQACQNPVVLPYALREVRALADSRTSYKDKKMRTRFATQVYPGPGPLPLTTKPTVFLDRDRFIAGWYFPHAFTSDRSAHVLESVKRLGDLPRSVLGYNGQSTNWRHDRQSYRASAGCTVKPGTVSLVPAWHELGHQPPASKPAPSSSFKAARGGALEFVHDEIRTNAVIGTILALVHPRLFNMQCGVFARILTGDVEVKDRPLMERVLQAWASPFTGFALISNRETPFHRDRQGGALFYDLVATFGRYMKGRFEVPLLGRRFAYNPGAAFVLPGYLLEHGACAVSGDRVCFASFIRPNVGVGVDSSYDRDVGLPTQGELELLLGLKISV